MDFLYKYLGFWLDYRLNMEHQIFHIMKKTNYIAQKLYPMLQVCSLETRSNMLELICRPLIEQTYALLDSEQSESNRKTLIRTARITFKNMTLLTQNISNKVVDKFMGKDISKQAHINVERAKKI